MTDFAAYPRLFPEIKQTRVVSTTGNVVRVEFRSEVVIAVRYVLDLACDPAALTVDWTFVEGGDRDRLDRRVALHACRRRHHDRLSRGAGREGAAAGLHPAQGHRRAGRRVAAEHVRVDRARGARAVRPGRGRRKDCGRRRSAACARPTRPRSRRRCAANARGAGQGVPSSATKNSRGRVRSWPLSRGVIAERRAQLARAGERAARARLDDDAVGEPDDRRRRANQDRARDAVGLGHEVHAVVHAVDQIDVQEARRTEHDRGARRGPATRVRRGVALAEIRLHLDDARRASGPSARWRRTSTLPRSSRATVVGRARVERARAAARGRRVASVTQQAVSRSARGAPVETVEQAAEAPVRLQRREHAGGGAPVAVAIEIAGHQPVAQEEERRLRDVGEAVAPQRLELPRVIQPFDLAAVDAVLAGKPDVRAAPSSDVIFAAP